MFEPNWVQIFSRIKAYNALVVPIISYGSDTWALRKKE
jgi:hypothetical protein